MSKLVTNQWEILMRYNLLDYQKSSKDTVLLILLQMPHLVHLDKQKLKIQFDYDMV